MKLLTPDEMGLADRLAADGGIDSYGLMIKAGYAVAAAFLKHLPASRRAVVLCGPGNNGGDGYVAAKALHEAGVDVSVFTLADPEGLKGDARRAFLDCPVVAAPLKAYEPADGDGIIDALFGAGLARPLGDELAALISAVEVHDIKVIAVDLPSGVSGLSGAVLGAAFQAHHTVTFMTPKPGHYLLPGRALCGNLDVFDIGIPRRLIDTAHGSFYLNRPELWRGALPQVSANSHKFNRGHLGVFSGPAYASGAARLSAMAGLKIGAGLVTLAVPEGARDVVATQTTAIMQKTVDSVDDVEGWLEDSRLSAFVLGPGFGAGEKAREFVRFIAERPFVLDADGITAFKSCPNILFEWLGQAALHCVMTPHQGEFSRVFPDIAADESLGKPEKALKAAQRANAVILYKGADTVIAEPDGRVAINANAPPWLATAGSGDVLAGIIAGLLAQGMTAFEAAAAGAWLHGEAGKRAGEGLTAQDLTGNLPRLSALS